MPCPYSDTPTPSPESFVARLRLLGKAEALVLADYIKERYPQLVFDIKHGQTIIQKYGEHFPIAGFPILAVCSRQPGSQKAYMTFVNATDEGYTTFRQLDFLPDGHGDTLLEAAIQLCFAVLGDKDN
ncbi:hypothetical protein GTA08_BOTSDO08201 [Botryosphaeria dothidea]|uniref:Uncharacterized protein n=1 Tax=Botryosphaeria dothidea TaxID=55169 RepID=A0A8H4IN62_9PEZI|nr:hypothetical protein GTA08_BOTSDO08201 [Botryosphaeria dothidea]